MHWTTGLEQQWQADHAEQFVEGLRVKNDYPGLTEALVNHPSEKVNRAALKTINQLDFTRLGNQIVDLIDQSLKQFLIQHTSLYPTEFVDAADILAKIKKPQGIGYLISFLDGPEPLKMKDLKVEWAFERCCGAIGEQGIDLILTHLLEHNGCKIQNWAAVGLGRIGGERAHDALVLALQHHCENFWGNGFQNYQTIDTYVNNIKVIGVKPKALDALKISLDLVKKECGKTEKEISQLHGPLLATSLSFYRKLIDAIEELIGEIQMEAK